MSAPKRVAHAAKTVLAAWERGVQVDPQSDAARALDDAGMLLDPEVAAELETLRKRVAELEAERHSTNEALSDAAVALRAAQARVAELEQRPSQADVAAWLAKKAREYPKSRRRQESAPEAVARLASKVARGAIRPKADESAARLRSLIGPSDEGGDALRAALVDGWTDATGPGDAS